MTYTTHNQENRIATIGTSLQGYVSVNYATLRELFGKPLDGDGYKVDAEWIIQFDDGTVATIYNYKDGKNYNGEDGTETTEITEWHIGGNNPRSVYLVKELIDDIPVSIRMIYAFPKRCLQYFPVHVRNSFFVSFIYSPNCVPNVVLKMCAPLELHQPFIIFIVHYCEFSLCKWYLFTHVPTPKMVK